MTANFERLSREPAFQALFMAARRRHYRRNSVIVEEGAPPEHLYLVTAGQATVRHTDAQGGELLLAYLYPGDFFGEMGLFADVPSRSAMIRSDGECTVLEIGYGAFLELTRRHERLWLELAGQLGARLRQTNHRLAKMPVLHAVDRIWLVLEEMAGHAHEVDAQGAVIHITRHDLGKLAGCSRELAGMILQDLASAGRLVLRGRAIVMPRSGET
jgi:CRP/FNR family cyclic AMP-dependent transcriptional regulator